MLLAALAEGHSVGMPQLDPSSFASQLFWLTVTFLLLYLIISRSALPRIHDVLEKRRQRIQFDLSQAEEMTEQAEKARLSFEKQQAESRARSAEMIAGAQKDAEKKLAEEQAKLDQEQQSNRRRFEHPHLEVAGTVSQPAGPQKSRA